MTDTLNQSQFPTRLAGRRGARESHEPRLLATNFAKGELPPPNTYADWDATNGYTNQWGMDGNDDWENCGAAGIDHGNMVKAKNLALLNRLGRPKYAGTLPTYWAYGLAMGEAGVDPHQPDQPDGGVDNKSWLGFLYENGIIYGYGEVPVDQMDTFAPQASGLLVAQRLPIQAEADFEANPQVPWGSPGEVPDQKAGHDTWYVKGSADGSGFMITWGALQPFTARYRTGGFITDAWIIYDADDPNLDHSALQAALAEVHGVVSPNAPVPEPTPAPPATDHPPVPNLPAPLPAFYDEWWAALMEREHQLEAWIKGRISDL